MKKLSILLLTLSLILAFSFTALADAHMENGDYDKVITVNPAGLVLGTFNASYESVQSNSRTYVINGSYYSYTGAGWDLSGFGGGVAMRMYNENNAPEGFYYGPLASALIVDATYDTDSASGTVFGFGGSAGYQWIADNDFAVSIEAGATYNTGSISAAGETAPYGSGVAPIIKVNIGKAF